MKILVIGASSFLGKKLFNFLMNEKIQTIGTYHMNPVNGVSFIRLNLLKIEDIEATLNEINPDVIIVLSAISTIEECERRKALALITNTLSVGYISLWCLNNLRNLIFISSECVFDGLSGPYYEWSPYSPINFYGKTKMLAEKIIREINCPFAIIRLPLLYGYCDEFDKETILKKVFISLLNGNKVALDEKIIKFPTLIDDVASGIVTLATNNLKGIFHFSSRKAFTKYEIGVEIADVFGFNKKLIKGTYIEKDSKITRPYKVELINTCFSELSFNGLKKGLLIVKDQILAKVGDMRKAYL